MENLIAIANVSEGTFTQRPMSKDEIDKYENYLREIIMDWKGENRNGKNKN